MLRKTISFALWLFICGFVLFICYIIGVMRNWSDLTVIGFWLSLTFISILLKCFIDYLKYIFLSGKYIVFFKKYYLRKKDSTLNSHLKKGSAILRKQGKLKIPWFLLTGFSDNNTSLLKNVSLPLFHCTGKEQPPQITRLLRWFFFRDVSTLELSEHLLSQTRIVNLIIKFISSQKVRKMQPAGLIIIIPVEKLLGNDPDRIKDLAQKSRSFIEKLSSKLERKIPVYIVITKCEMLTEYATLVQSTFLNWNNYSANFYWLSSKSAVNNFDDKAEDILVSLKKNLTSSICYSLGDTLSEIEKNEMLLLPEKLMSLEPSLDMFLSTMCIENLYFPKTKLSGVFLSADVFVNNDRHYCFPDVLVSDILPKITNNKNKEYVQPKRKSIFVLFVTSLLLIYCGYIVYRAPETQSITSDSNPEFVIDRILKYEGYTHSPILFLPIYPIAKYKILQLNKSLYKNNHVTTYSLDKRINELKMKFFNASTPTKRDLILSLASSLITWGKMKDNELLLNLKREHGTLELIRLTKTDENYSSLTMLAVERAVMQSSDGDKIIKRYRQLLTELIISDPTYSWFLSESKSIPDVRLSDFWAGTKDSISLSGMWTLQGQDMLYNWYNQINKAYGDNTIPEEFSLFVKDLDLKRQAYYRQFIVSVSNVRENSNLGFLNPHQLANILYNRSAEMLFFQYINKQLAGIPTTVAQDWLLDFRLFNELLQLRAENRIERRIKVFFLMLKINLAHVFNTSGFSITSEHITRWWEWQDSLRQVINDGFNDSLSVELMRKAIISEKNNKLSNLFIKFDRMKYMFIDSNADPVMASVWSIYEGLLFQLLDHAKAHTDCWVDAQWQKKVLRPLSENSNSISHSVLQEYVYKNIINFLDGSVKSLMERSSEGARPLLFKGRAISFLPPFILFINDVVSPDDLLDIQFQERTQNKDTLLNVEANLHLLREELQKLESQPYKISIKSAPATISSNSRVKPIGTYLELECESGNSHLKSMNFADSAMFNWYPGRCKNVSVNIEFPGFFVTHNLHGDSSWTDFLNKFYAGETELMVNDFSPKNKYLLEAMDIKSILVRYEVSDATAINQAYIEWSQLKEKVDKLEGLHNDLNHKLQMKAKREYKGWLSRLPKKITECGAFQE